jgi:hypothetical protein
MTGKRFMKDFAISINEIVVHSVFDNRQNPSKRPS